MASSPDVERTWQTHAVTFVLGVWTMGTIFVSVVATQNFFTIDRLLEASSAEPFAVVVDEIGPERARPFLRFLSSELNRLYFQLWNVAQIGLGGVALALIWRVSGMRRLRLVVAAMLLVVLYLTVWVTPDIITLGRQLDFMPRDPAPPELTAFGRLHATYATLEILKGATALGVACWISLWRDPGHSR